MANNTNSVYAFIDDKRTLPFNVTGTGTLSTNGVNIVGVGTAFTSQLKRGSWLVDLTNDEVRLVTKTDSDTVAYLNQAFSSDLSSGAFQYIPQSSADAREISIIIPFFEEDGTTVQTWGEVNGEIFPSATPYTLSKANNDQSYSNNYINPIVVDATNTQMSVSILY